MITLTLVIGVIIGISLNASAQEQSIIPSWIKNTAKFWASGGISDNDYIASLQWLIDNGILKIPQTQTKIPASVQSTTNLPQPDNAKEGFSGTSCQRQFTNSDYVDVTGKYTNGPKSYSAVFLQGVLLDTNGNVLATGLGEIKNIDPYQTKIFDIPVLHSGDFAKCQVDVDSVYSP